MSIFYVSSRLCIVPACCIKLQVRGIGLVDFPAPAILAALRAGVPITSISITYSLTDAAAHDVLQLAREYGIKVQAAAG